LWQRAVGRETDGEMPQLQLPIFPADVTPINQQVAVSCESGKVVYVHGLLPVFQHERGDLASFRLFTSQMIANGSVRHSEIARTFGVPLATVKRYVKLYREKGAQGFFAPRRRRSAVVLTPEVKAQAQALLEEGKSVPEVGTALGILPDTLRKAIGAGYLHPRSKKKIRL
jgi:transposase-like protein